MAEVGTSQDTERKQPSKGHSLSGDSRGRDKSGHRKKATEQGALTSWRWQREGQSQNMERKQLSKRYSQPGDSRGRNKSGHGKKATE